MARIWINNPGEDDPWGSQRPSYWAGNGTLPRVAQHLDTALAIFDPSQSRLKWTHAYVGRDGFDDLAVYGDWLVGRSGHGFAGVYSSNGLEVVETGPTGGREIRSREGACGWAVVVASGDKAAFENFKKNILASEVAFDPSALTLSLRLPGRPAVELGYDSGLAVNGRPKPFTHHQPDPTITYDSALTIGAEYCSLSETIL